MFIEEKYIIFLNTFDKLLNNYFIFINLVVRVLI